MATESPNTHDGTLTSLFDGRDSTYSGSTRAGPNGSAQFCAVVLSSTADRSINMSTVVGQAIYGILQNKPRVGEAADVVYSGITKAVAGSTAISAGAELMTSSTTSGALIPYSTSAGQRPCGVAREAAATIGQIFSARIYGAPGGSSAV